MQIACGRIVSTLSLSHSLSRIIHFSPSRAILLHAHYVCIVPNSLGTLLGNCKQVAPTLSRWLFAAMAVRLIMYQSWFPSLLKDKTDTKVSAVGFLLNGSEWLQKMSVCKDESDN